MASEHTTPPSRKRNVQRTNGDSARWIAGLVLFFAGLYITSSVLFYFLCWRSDLSVLQGVGAEDPRFDGSVENLCGRSGAWLGELIAGRGFGLFGILLPVMLMLVGVRIIRRKPLMLNHSILSLFLIMILGSLTLGFVFGDKFNLIASSGWGGALGIEAARMLDEGIGAVGTALVLLGGWILTGVFINRNFINTVNSAGNAVVDKGGRIVEIVKHRVVPTHSRGDGAEGADATDGQTCASAVRQRSGAVGETVRPAAASPGDDDADRRRFGQAGTEGAALGRPAAARSAEEAATADAVSPASSATAARFGAAGRTGVPVEIEKPAMETAEPRGGRPLRPAATGEDDPFVVLTTDGGATSRNAEMPAAPARGRVVMGSDGLIELDLSDEGAAAPAASQSGVDPVVAERLLSGLKDAGPEEGLTEILLDEGGGETALASAGAARERAAVHAAAEGLTELTLGGADAGGQCGSGGDAGRGGTAVHAAAEGLTELTLGEAGAAGTAQALPVAGAAAAGRPSDAAAAADGSGIVITVEERRAALVDERKITTEAYDPLKDLVNYRRPPVSLLEDYQSDSEVSDEEIYENKSRIEETLKYFNIPIQRIKATVGPTVTLYEIVQAQGVKISKIQGLENDIAQSLKALGIRIIAPIPGKGTIGIEVPNRDKQVVSMYSAVRSMRFQESRAELPVVIGRTIQNENYVFDLAKMPHLLVAGATGQGKSVGLNAIITSLLYKKHPAQLKFVMIDPKMVEFSLYAKIERHFLAKMESEEEAIITDPKKAVYTLNSLCTEMDNRLELCKKAGARNIAEYNEKFVSRRLNPQNGHRYLPYIVVVVDEFADLIMTAREVEGPVMRLAQKARAIGIHLIIATQRPDVKVITGGIKANFPARIAFRVMQMIDSRTIIDQPGANQLIGRGDMLFSKDGELTRIQCALVETREVERIVDYISKQQGYTEPYPLPDYTPETGSEAPAGGESGAPVKYDSLFAEIARSAVSGGSISTSMIQRNYEVGFNRAGRIMMQLERAGIVGRQEGAKPRDILYHDLPSLEARLQELDVF
ncbi:DNA translocase FtsK [Alistipes sp. CHKCI003]|uniref:DNA translocase FtsK n=1 Tax=Alistipes sp. CHKCI003 TaxID=1780376 RepID=UPI0007A87BAF|nr:DNA translocase FtsK [Alistipes sp. CHKCI003]CVI68777.1 DNA translocase SpoIIIE [Alistipes sp. CHKCI003]